MSCGNLYDGGVTDKDESRLFCTPPSEEILAELDCWIGEERDAEGKAETFGPGTPGPSDCHHTRSRQAPNKFIRQLSRSSRMAGTRHALTRSTNSSKGALMPSTNHLAKDGSGRSHLAASSLSNAKPDSVATSLPKQPEANSLLSQLIGYMSSEEEANPAPRKKEVKVSTGSSTTIKIRRKHTLHVPKSTQVILSNSESEASIDTTRTCGRTRNETISTSSTQRRANLPASRARTSHKFEQSRTSSSAPDKAQLSPSRKSNKPPSSGSTMKSGAGINNKFASDVKRKRPASPKASMKNNKRARTKGGFLMSDESEAEEYDDESEDDDSEPAASPSPRERVVAGGEAAGIEMSLPPALPTKQINKSRLNMLLGRNRNTQPPLTKNTQSVLTRPRTISSRAATTKQGNTQNEQNGKVTAVNSSVRRTDATPMQEIPVESNAPSGKDLQIRRSLGSISSTLSSQGSGKPPESNSVSRESSVLSKSALLVNSSGHGDSGPSTIGPRGASIGSDNSMKINGCHAHRVANGAEDVRRSPTAAKHTGLVPSSASQTRRSEQSPPDKTKPLLVVASSKPSQERIRQQTLPGKQTPTSTPEKRPTQRPVHKQSDQPPSLQLANQVQSLNKVAPSSPLLRGTNPSRPQNRNPNPAIAECQPVADPASKPETAHGAQMAQKRKVENISGGPSDSAVLVKKPGVAPKFSSMSARPTSLEKKGMPEPRVASSNSPKVTASGDAEKPTARANSGQYAQSKASSTRAGSHTLPTTTPPTKIPGTKTGKPIEKPLVTPVSADMKSLNRSKDVRVPPTTSIKATTTDHSDKPNKSLVSRIVPSTSSHEAQKATSAPRPTSVKDSSATTSVSKEPTAATNESRSKTQIGASRMNSSLNVMTVASSPKGLQLPVSGLRGVSRSAQSPPAVTVESQNGKNTLPEHAVAHESISKSIPVAVLHPSFNPTTNTRPQRAPSVTPSCLATTAPVGATQSGKGTQNTSQVAKIVNTIITEAPIQKNAANSPARPSIITLKTAATQTNVNTLPENDVAPPRLSETEATGCSSTAVHHLSNTPSLSKSLESPEQSEPYFEYSVFQRVWSSEQNENVVAATEIIVRRCTNANEANLLAEQLFETMREQYLSFLHVDFSEQAMKRDSQNCLTISGAFSPYNYPDQTFHIQIWVERNFISKYANPSPQVSGMTPFIRKEVYILRLFKVIPAPDASDVESDGQAKLPIRVYHKLPCNEIYTTLDAANRAARSLQVELAHVKTAKDDITARWQEQNLAELNAKVHALDPSMGGEEGCWKSEFNACGRGGDRLELMVERAGITGPRN